MPEKKETGISLAERFTNSVVSAYADVAKGVAVNEHQRELIANYFVEIDTALKNSKQGYQWKQVRMNELALSVAHLSRLNLDMKLSHCSFIPFRYKDTGTITLVPVISSRGWEYIVKTFSLEPVKNVIVELVYETDSFSIVKKDSTHPYDNYEFSVKNPFNRGKVIGGFAYAEFNDPSLNKLLVMSLADIIKFKPSRADESFWGEHTASYTKMLEKTIAKQLMKKIPLNPDKIHGVKDSFKYMESEELVGASLDAKRDISEKNGVGDFVDVDYEPIEGVENPVEPVEDTPVDENEVVTPEDDVLGMNETLFK